jgi:hypothetical protein
MKWSEALNMLINGHRVTHRDWNTDEFLLMRGRIIYDEVGNKASVDIRELRSSKWISWQEPTEMIIQEH